MSLIVCSQAAPFGLPSRLRGLKGGEKKVARGRERREKKSLVLQIVVVVSAIE